MYSGQESKLLLIIQLMIVIQINHVKLHPLFIDILSAYTFLCMPMFFFKYMHVS
jgi:hypothetical protein